MTAINTYEDLRGTIRDGDLAFFSGTSFLAKAIKRVTGSPWSHVGILFWEYGDEGDEDNTLMLHEAVAEGCRAIRLSMKLRETPNPVEICRSGYIDSEAKRAAIRRHSHRQLAIEYGKWQLVQIWARVRFGIGRRPHFDKELICSELVAACYARAGYYFDKANSDFVSPADLYRDPWMRTIATLEKTIELERYELP